MLKQILQYAQMNGITSEPGFTKKKIRYAIHFNSEGNYLGVMPIGDEKDGKEFHHVPLLNQGQLIGDGGRCQFLHETAGNICLLAVTDSDDKCHKKHQYFIRLLKEAASKIPVLGHIAQTLSDEQTLLRIQEDCQNSKIKNTNTITLMVADKYPLDDDECIMWWRDHYTQLNKPQQKTTNKKRKGDAICFISGEPTTPCKHPVITGLSDVDGAPYGSKLISFDKDAFQSYGLGEEGNCVISESHAAAYTSTIVDLIQKQSKQLGKSKTKIVYWFKEQIPEIYDMLQFVASDDRADMEAAHQRMRDLLGAIYTGKRVDLLNNRYYVLTLSGSSSRVMVRDWIEGEIPALVNAINRWFDDFSLLDGYGLPVRCPSVPLALKTTVRDPADVPAPWARLLWRAAVTGGQIPRNMLPMALKRFTMQIVAPSETDKSEFNLDRTAFIKAILVRNYEGGKHIMQDINMQHPDPAYHAGRIMALYARLQRAALGDVNAGVVQRYYASASSTPALVLGRLARLSQFHLGKLDGGLAYWFESEIAKAWEAMGTKLPVSLSLEQQGLFAMGYYQQIASMIKSKNNTTEEHSNE